MADNPGAYPLDPTTDVGRLRAIIGDTQSEPYDPPRPGVQNYAMYSDSELEAFLIQADGDVSGGAYFVYLQMATAAAMESKSVKDLDLSIDLTKRSGDLRAIAALWKDRWDDAIGAGDIFEVFDTVVGGGCGCDPELAARSFCRKGCYGGRFF